MKLDNLLDRHMRLSKYRAWDIRNQRMLYPQRLLQALNVLHMMEITSDFQFIEMQFIGLQDKHGTDIYEDDIVQDEKDNRLRFIVHYLCDSKYACFCLKSLVDNQIYWFEHSPADCLEIIGNVHLNPNLLEVK